MNEVLNIPKWATKISYNYRGNALLMDETGEQVVEVVIDENGMMYV